MKKILSIFITFLFAIIIHAQPTRTIFITGGDFSTPFIKYVISLTHKSNHHSLVRIMRRFTHSPLRAPHLYQFIPRAKNI